MQPYQEASEEIKRQGQFPHRLAKEAVPAAIGLGTTFAAGKLASRVLPMLSQYVPQDLAIKGLNKIDPRFGKFIEKAIGAGESFDEIKDFIGGKAQEGAAIENQNVIKKYDDKLHEFLKKNIEELGLTPAQAVGLIDIYPQHKKNIEKLEKDYKVPFISLVEQVYGKGEKGKQSQQQAPEQMQQQGTNPAREQLMQAMQALSQKLKT